MNSSLAAFTRRTGLLLGVGALSILLVGCSSSTPKVGAATGAKALVGTFHLTAGTCGASGAAGTYFRMINPGGSIASGPFFENPDSRCSDKSYTLATAGSDGGLVTGRYQPNPSPAFDAKGDARAAGIVNPQSFTGIDFSLSTDPVDPQARRAVPVPSINAAGGVLTGQLEAWSVAWNNQYFNQGSPKPGGSSPGLTAPVSGTYDSTTRAFALTWASQVVGGPFNGFTGYWHLQGTFAPAG
ncbi:MAG TPA: hypothetical protein VNF50_07070 [Acidimicrobiales bacterium]|nr:hypothetical protein [Acidimicrobiales bacterium]